MKTMTTNKFSIGNDIIDIDRIERSIQRHGKAFLNKIFTPKEQEYCLKFRNPYPSLAGRFSAKEAIAKALGTGFGKHVKWTDIEIVNLDSGKPIVILAEHTQEKFNHPKFEISISHTMCYATAVAICFYD